MYDTRRKKRRKEDAWRTHYALHDSRRADERSVEFHGTAFTRLWSVTNRIRRISKGLLLIDLFWSGRRDHVARLSRNTGEMPRLTVRQSGHEPI